MSVAAFRLGRMVDPYTNAPNDADYDPLTDNSVVPPESSAEEVFAAAANAIPAMGMPIMMDPYVIAEEPEAPPAAPYVAPVSQGAPSYSTTGGMPAAPAYGGAPNYGQYGANQPYGQPYGAQSPYGAPGNAAYPYGGYPAQPRTDSMAIAALVSGIAGLTFIPIIGSILGIVFGVIANGRIRAQNLGGRGMALAGIIMGAVGIVLSIVGIILIATVWRGVINDPSIQEWFRTGTTTIVVP